MVRLANPKLMVAVPGGRSFYAPIRQPRRKQRAPAISGLKEARVIQRAARHAQLVEAFEDARDVIQQQAAKLHESFDERSKKYYEQEIMQRGRLVQGRRGPSRWNAYVRGELKRLNAEIPPGQPKLRSNMVAQEISDKWGKMDKEAKIAVTDPLMDELVTARKEADMKPKMVPVHVLNDVTATMSKITRELDCLYARTGYETILFGVRTDHNHYSPPLVHAPGGMIPKFFNSVMKKQTGDLAAAMEAYCLSGIDGVVDELKKKECRLRGDLVNLVNSKLRELTGSETTRMIYKNFDRDITRKHGIVLEGWPLARFDNPSSIGSRVELEVLLNSWKSGATRFRQMGTEEHMAWIESYADKESSNSALHFPTSSTSAPPPVAEEGHSPTTALVVPVSGAQFNVLQFESLATLPATPDTSRVEPKKRKTRSDKGRPRKKAAQLPGESVFLAGMS